MSFIKGLISLLIIFLPSIIKSVQEKKKFEEKKRRRPIRPRMTLDDTKVKKVEEVEENIEREELEIDSIETYEKEEEKQIERSYKDFYSKKEDTNALKSSTRSKNVTKEDILKGVVMKEILSKPKCMQNRIR